MLNDLVAFKACAGDKEGILEIYLILFIVRFISELNEAENREFSFLIGVIGDISAPNLISFLVGNIVSCFGLDAFIFGRDNSISSTVAAFALILIKRL